mmetsp:Transcript_66572/g.124225  ORF Transcript_66572/g.124225 Transcript_66572/m.124225 type:complete len:150 (-) Transcript_66572:47-496(-)
MTAASSADATSLSERDEVGTAPVRRPLKRLRQVKVDIDEELILRTILSREHADNEAADGSDEFSSGHVNAEFMLMNAEDQAYVDGLLDQIMGLRGARQLVKQGQQPAGHTHTSSRPAVGTKKEGQDISDIDMNFPRKIVFVKGKSVDVD